MGHVPTAPKHLKVVLGTSDGALWDIWASSGIVAARKEALERRYFIHPDWMLWGRWDIVVNGARIFTKLTDALDAGCPKRMFWGWPT
jgi:hypothetical protein